MCVLISLFLHSTTLLELILILSFLTWSFVIEYTVFLQQFLGWNSEGSGNEIWEKPVV